MLDDNYFSPKRKRFQYKTTFFAGLFILAITIVLSYTAGRIFEETLNIAINANKDEVLAKAKEGKQTLYAISAAIFILSLIVVYFISDRIEKERIRLRKEKRYHKKWLKNIVENSPLGIIFTDKNGIIEYVNPKYTEMTGYTVAEVIGKKPSILKSGVHNRDFYQKLWDTITNGKMWHGEVANQKKSGDVYWEEMYIVPIADESGKIGSFVASKIDITERKWLFNELVQANCELNELTEKLTEREENLKKINDHLTELVQEESANIIHKEKLLFQQSKMAAMGEMIGMIAHQWRQPLNALSAAAIKINMLNELGTLSKEQLVSTMEFIQELAQKMSATINDFMDFSRPNREKELVSVKKVFESAITIIHPQLETRNITLTLDLEDDIKLFIYKKELAHIMLNLLANARDAFENKEIVGKAINIKTYQNDRYTIIEVSDNAGGIEHSIIDKIFDPFFTTKPTEKGTGLGLYMSKMMVMEHMGGEISATTVGTSALFKISIPHSGKNPMRFHINDKPEN
ncbi:MAG: PAS domain-containing sensor histidine kinase [Sulfuricurvum sp.]|jgi:PAS domain S-box-containing protein|uniref:PAS domain-containing sensor histidine kinase n=1 Tax=Sulfuricurvum sp. TaxID=2025608 RepID=UPI0025EFBA0F|nr:PAS domain-containing sensor histidine kinase [Sulfuricurvum sp.]MCK9372024.1 PAS domain-containing sensor histidine kinase [Sulfuricurvum sp.]